MAGRIRARKLDAIAATGATVVISANPGCAIHLAAAGIDVRHPVEIIDAALPARPPTARGWPRRGSRRG
jgi:glycolate oxidase iron-sulfur subunit